MLPNAVSSLVCCTYILLALTLLSPLTATQDAVDPSLYNIDPG